MPVLTIPLRLSIIPRKRGTQTPVEKCKNNRRALLKSA